MDGLMAFPAILLAIALMAARGPGVANVIFALSVVYTPRTAMLIRSTVLTLRELDYVQAARALGVSDFKITLRHIVPNLMHLVVIRFVLLFSGLVLSEAVLAWLGIGVDGSWGQMVAQAKDELSRDPLVWWNIAAAGVSMFGLLLSVNIIGDAVRDVLDPRTAREYS